MKKILIIEDDKEIAELERDYLTINGFSCDIESWGNTGLYAALNNDYDLFIVDVMLPGMDGFEIVSRIREHKETPVIFLSARADDIDKIRGLGLGADDYMTKPFSPNELVARVKARISRYEVFTAPKNDKIQVRGLCIDPNKHCVEIDGKPITMTATEFELLYYLASNPNRPISKEQLFDRVWGTDAIGDTSTVAVHIQHVRDKLSVSGEKFIDTVWGIGYRFLK